MPKTKKRRDPYDGDSLAARALTQPELERLTAHVRQILNSGTPTHRRDALAVLLGLSGLRISEVCNLNRNDLRTSDDGDEWLRVRTLKGGRKRLVPVEQRLADQLRNLRHRKPSGPMLEVESGGRINARNLRRSWHRIREAAGIDPARFHDLRHTCAIAAWEASGHNLFVVSTILGHAKIENTRIYLARAGMVRSSVIPFDVPAVRSALKPDPKAAASESTQGENGGDDATETTS